MRIEKRSLLLSEVHLFKVSAGLNSAVAPCQNARFIHTKMIEEDFAKEDNRWIPDEKDGHLPFSTHPRGTSRSICVSSLIDQGDVQQRPE
jgi:hypothetical protein